MGSQKNGSTNFNGKVHGSTPNSDLPLAEQATRFNNTTRSAIAQILATLGFGVLLCGIGMIWSMPTIVIGGLNKNDTELTMDEEATSWFGSVIYISQPLGSIASGFLQEKLGRKRTMVLVNIPQFIGWIVIYYASSIPYLYFAAVLLGLSLGFMEAPALSYIGEITEPRMRGMMSSLSGSMAGFGILIECFIGALTDWRSTMLISAIVPVIAIITVSMIPESPTWLVVQGRISEAEQALCWLRGWVHPMHVRKEFIAILEYTQSPALKEMVTIQSSVETKDTPEKLSDQAPLKQNNAFETFALLAQPKMYRPLRLILTYFFISQVASLLAVRPFLIPIFNEIGMPLDPNWVVVISGGLQILGAFFGMGSMKFLGKRKTNFISLTTCIVCCFVLGGSLMMTGVNPWVPFLLFCALFFASGFGVIPLPWILLSELFPLDGRGIGGGLAAAVCYFLAFIVTKTYINLSTWFHIYGTFYIYGALSVAGLIFLYYCLPETEGKTLEEIEEFFKDKPQKLKGTTEKQTIEVKT